MMQQAMEKQRQEVKQRKKEEEIRQQTDIMTIIKKDREAEIERNRKEALRKRMESNSLN